ncbi:MAG: hypothetical protein JOZ87_27260 [Chloroflexi bacterium]|nr:hypothetical protein [Chloroflexota bacterium]
MKRFHSTRVAALAGAALLSVALGGVASAQTLPGGLPSLDGNDQLKQVVLAGEATAVAQFLGISTDQLQSELVGKSLAQVTQQHGKSVSDVTNVVVDSADQQLDAAVSQGQLSSDAAAQYRNQIGFFAPFLVNSPEASAMALQAVGS